jgi:hypothetical protein
VASPNMEGLPSYNDIDAIRRAPLLALEERYGVDPAGRTPDS